MNVHFDYWLILAVVLFSYGLTAYLSSQNNETLRERLEKSETENQRLRFVMKPNGIGQKEIDDSELVWIHYGDLEEVQTK